ncbi:fructose-1,6-bisphosphatase II [Cryobacterium sp. MP_M5]|uniref:fructose-bisphosphatase class II family protein n=1 Tax=unclassified Cryobacterium TaxID=2649013 RepID=UPI0018CA449F|nr:MULTISPECIES: fructose-bisphosphatase class II [unclassified Cryobacterium]MBG6056585.1 fructose-1,6-bisphosphatase II [Cryobacterium sp. MP_M3]MEC5176258.1 fructose-1,6-bisphosphatase II [Cryobacterium sp. MP_M5]
MQQHSPSEGGAETTVIGAEAWPADLVEAIRSSTAAAALAARAWVGRGDKIAADAAAVAAMRAVLMGAPFSGTVVIREGEKDAAPMLANGERLGSGQGPECDIAVDPLDGTSLAALARPGAVSVIAIAPRGTMFDPAGVFYMEKLIAGAAGLGVLDLRRSPTENLRAYAAASGLAETSLTVAVLDKPRHAALIRELRAAGATVSLTAEGDVSTAIAAATPGTALDLVMGIGGTPEGVIAACAVRALGGVMLGRMAPQSEAEALGAHAAGRDLARLFDVSDLVASSRVLFASSPVT